MTRTASSVAVLGLALLALGCRTRPMPEPTRIPVPSGLGAQQVEVAVLSAILNTPPPRNYDPARVLPPDEFDAFLWRELIGQGRGRSWFPESREPGTIYASVDTRGHYLKTAIRLAPDSLSIEIVESKNLLQGDGKIHRKVIGWIANLEAHIRRELARMASYSARPTSPSYEERI